MLTWQDIVGRRAEILGIAQRHGAFDLRIIGSVARGDAQSGSDVDFIARFEPGRSLFDHGALVMDLRDLLGTAVDVIDEDAMRPRFRDHALRIAVPV